MPSSLEEYQVLQTIGTGSYGVCKKVQRKKDGKILVWKELLYGAMSDSEKQLLVSEVNLLRELRHKYIVRYYDRIIDRSTTTLYIIMEHCEGGDLGSIINRLKKDGGFLQEDFVWRVCVQVLIALQECHCRSKGGRTVLHRDLKPANVFLDATQNVKLGDFGLARVLNHETSFAQTYVGTPFYMSPEQMNYQSYDEKSDVWSLGCLLYEMCALRPPFTAGGLRELSAKINIGRFNRIPSRYSDELHTLICTMLQVDGGRRPSVEELLQHSSIARRVSLFNTSEPRSLDRLDKGCSVSSDEGYGSKVDYLKRREDTLLEKELSLREREQQLQRRERDIEAREKSVAIQERLLEERKARMNSDEWPTGIKKDDKRPTAAPKQLLWTKSTESMGYNPSLVLQRNKENLENYDASRYKLDKKEGTTHRPVGLARNLPLVGLRLQSRNSNNTGY